MSQPQDDRQKDLFRPALDRGILVTVHFNS
jgi:hypothetical protein